MTPPFPHPLISGPQSSRDSAEEDGKRRDSVLKAGVRSQSESGRLAVSWASRCCRPELLKTYFVAFFESRFRDVATLDRRATTISGIPEPTRPYIHPAAGLVSKPLPIRSHNEPIPPAKRRHSSLTLENGAAMLILQETLTILTELKES